MLGKRNATARRIGPILLGVVSACVVGAGIAWACTPSAEISVTPDRGRIGDSATVTGVQFRDGPVDIRWGAPDGELLSSTNVAGGSFSVAVTVPQSSSGLRYVYAVQASGGIDSDEFQVLAEPSPQTQPDPGGAPPPPESPGATPGAETPSQQAPGGGGQGAGNTGGAGGAEGTGAGATPAPTGAAATAAAEAPAGLPEPAAQTSAAADTASQGAGAADAARSSAVGDLWSGLSGAASGDGGPFEAAPAQAEGSPGFILPLAVSLLGLGMVALVGAADAYAVRRGRAGILPRRSS